MALTIAVIDGMGGGIGAQAVARLREALPADVEIIALGTNSTAAERMLRAGAGRGASGENAIRVSVGAADVIIGPIGIVIPNGMMGEVTPAVAEAVMAARGEKLLIPVAQPHFVVVGLEQRPLGRQIAAAVSAVRRRLGLPPLEPPDAEAGAPGA
jgi:hypothetical protein